MRTTPRVYIYLDAPGIESLYAQIVDELVMETSRTSSSGRDGKATSKVGVGGALLKLLGLAEASVEVGASLSKGQMEERKSTLTVEHKLAKVLDHVDQTPNGVAGSIISAAARCRETSTGCYLFTVTTFNMPQFYGGRLGVDRANAGGHLAFQMGAPDDDTYNHSDEYYKTPNLHVVMAASVSKLTRVSSGSMSATGHDAMYFRGHRGKNVPLGVFGFLTRIADLYQLKPYALWLPD